MYQMICVPDWRRSHMEARRDIVRPTAVTFQSSTTATFASSDAGADIRNGYGPGEPGVSGTSKGSLSRRRRLSHVGGYRGANEGYAAAELRKLRPRHPGPMTALSHAVRRGWQCRRPRYLPSGVADA